MKVVRVLAVLGGFALAAWTTASVAGSAWVHAPSVYDRTSAWVLVAAAWVLPLCGAVLWTWRPSNREGPAMVLLGAAWAAWGALGASGGAAAAWGSYLAVVFRPLLFWMVLAWPTGRLRSADARWLGVFSILQLAIPAGTTLLFTPELGGSGVQNPLMVVELVAVANAAGGFYSSIVLPVGAALLAGSSIRRYRRLPPAARSLMVPALAAAIVAAVGDINLVASDYFRGLLEDHRGRTLAGGVVIYLDLLRFSLAPLLLVVAAARTRQFARSTAPVRTLDLGAHEAAARLDVSVAAAIGDPTARVAFAQAERGFVDQSGTPVELGAPGRAVTRIERDGKTIAAVEHDASLVDRPALVELSVAAAGASIEFERLAAIANARRVEALRVRRTIVEVQDRARHRLERDLHDGAQQRLVGLALQASLGARDGDAESVAHDLARGVEDARRDLRDVASGLLPSLLADQGLAASLTALAATAPMTVDVDVHQPDHVPPDVMVAAWFVVAEAVANASKHAAATQVTVRGGIDAGTLAMEIVDDGCGGADLRRGGGLDGLRDRVARSGGVLTVDSPRGAGTRVRACFPLESVR